MAGATGGGGGGGGSEEDEDLFAFIGRLDAEATARLYGSCRWAALGVLQHLGPLARQMVMRLLAVGRPTPWTFWESCVTAETAARARLREARDQMLALKVLVSDRDRDTLSLSPSFRDQIALALADDDTQRLPWQDENVAKRAHGVDLAKLESRARRKWTAILHFIVGSSEFRPPDARVIKLLVSMGLMQHRADMPRPKITRAGYHFMLRDIHNQLWLFIRHYTQQVERPESVLQMLFKMCFCKPGSPCSAASLDRTQRTLLDDFELFGLVSRDASGSDVFYPTSLGVNIVFGQSREEKMAAAARAIDMDPTASGAAGPPPVLGVKPENPDQVAKRARSDPNAVAGAAPARLEEKNVFIIVETNFKCYCYTESSLHVEMIKLFAEPECILPNLLVAVITRSSIREAFKMGITADQIIHFLVENAHPLCENRHRPVPDNITDQILLWEGERNRVVSEVGLLFDKFLESEDDLFQRCVRFAERNGWLRFVTHSPRALVVDELCRGDMRDFIKAQRRAGA